ncbi:MAG: HesA/MoeB/ThiF family protein [Nitrospinae bacterium]|nr:HesA/MoeB/ThiF family protein [Nitrospinota bacterium]
MEREELKRYRRQLLHPGFTESHQKKLKSSVVLLAGVGGLGGAVAYGLTAAGVGNIIVVHSGNLTESNLNRQTLMGESALGLSRAKTAAGRIAEFNRFVNVEAHDLAANEKTLEPLAKRADLIIDARHNFPERRALNKVAVEKKVPLLYAAMDAMSAQTALFVPETTGCFECLYPESPPDWDPFGFPVFGAVAHTIGALTALEAIKYLSGFGEVSRSLNVMDFNRYDLRKFRLHRRPDCPVCGQKE